LCCVTCSFRSLFDGFWFLRRRRVCVRPPRLPAADVIPILSVSSSLPRDRQRRLTLGATAVLSLIRPLRFAAVSWPDFQPGTRPYGVFGFIFASLSCGLAPGALLRPVRDPHCTSSFVRYRLISAARILWPAMHGHLVVVFPFLLFGRKDVGPFSVRTTQ